MTVFPLLNSTPSSLLKEGLSGETDMDVNFEQPKKILLSILLTLAGMVMPVREPQV